LVKDGITFWVKPIVVSNFPGTFGDLIFKFSAFIKMVDVIPTITLACPNKTIVFKKKLDYL
jgi:hypothetical protein